MEMLGDNPFGVLTFIVAPAIMTNASSVMALGTSNRFARAIDRARMLATQLDAQPHDVEASTSRRRQLEYTEHRAQLLVRALTAFYLSVGAFGAASLISLLGSVLFLFGQIALHRLTLALAFAGGLVGVGGLVCGSGLLVAETRMVLRVLKAETKELLKPR